MNIRKYAKLLAAQEYYMRNNNNKKKRPEETRAHALKIQSKFIPQSCNFQGLSASVGWKVI